MTDYWMDTMSEVQVGEGERNPRNPFDGFRVEVDPEKVDEALKRLRDRLESARDAVEEGVTQARHTKVRVSYKGKQLGGDLPLSVFLAGEGVALAAIGPLYALLANLGAKAMLEVEFVHASDQLVRDGREAYGHGEVVEAERLYRDALARRRDDPAALYHLGVLLRVTGREDEAVACFRKAAMGPEGHPEVTRAAELLDRLAGKRTL